MQIARVDTDGSLQLSPDLVLVNGCGDLAITDATEPRNPNDLRCRQAIATAVFMALQTDIRVGEEELPDSETNRGWAGDGFDMDGEAPLGSRLWLLRREALTPDVVLRAEDYAREALQPLLDTEVFVRFDVRPEPDFSRDRLDLFIDGFGRDGDRTYHDRFAVLWNQLDAVHAPLAD